MYIVQSALYMYVCIVQILPNGLITFTSPSLPESIATSTSTPKPFPIEDRDFIAPYWFDSNLLFGKNVCNESNDTSTHNTSSNSFINETLFNNQTSFVNKTDCRNISTVYYRRSFDYDHQQRASREIRAAFHDAGINFFTYNLFIVTWVINDPNDASSQPKVMIKYILEHYSYIANYDV